MSSEALKARVGWKLARTQEIGEAPDPIPPTTGRVSRVIGVALTVEGLLPASSSPDIAAQLVVRDVRGLEERSMDYSSEVARVLAEIGRAAEGRLVKVSFLDGTPYVDSFIVRDPAAPEFQESPDIFESD